MTASFVIHDHVFSLQEDCSDVENFVVTSRKSQYSVDCIPTIALPENSIVVVDQTLFNLFKNKIAFQEDKTIFITATEENKTLASVSILLSFFSQHNLSKSSIVTVIGGGITQEIAAFACAIYKRGIAYHHFPTTLLSMSDSCIGGKTSLNFEGAKNQLGLFNPPQKVFIYLEFIKTLSDSAIQSGLGEILKSCIIGGDHYVRLYQQEQALQKKQSHSTFKKLIFAALRIKKTIVEYDEYEKKYRAALNFGHTLGHAIEAFLEYKVSHGQAIAVGIILENNISHQLAYLSAENRDFLNGLCFSLIDKKIKALIKKIAAAQLMPLIQKDKKTQGGHVNFALLKKPGELVFVNLALDSTLLARIAAALMEF